MAKAVVTKAGVRLAIYNERFLTEVLKVIASNREISRRSLNNIVRFMTMCDRVWYARDFIVGALMEAIGIVMDSRLDGTFDSLDEATVRNTVLAKVSTTISSMYNEAKENLIIPTISIWKSRESQAEFVFKNIDLNIKYASILSDKEEFSDIMTDISSGNVSNLERGINQFRAKMDELLGKFKMTDNSSKNKAVIHLTDADYVETHLKDLFKKIKNPKSNLQTGVRMFNEMLSNRGGFVNGKYYMIYADVNSFKSALLLHITRWIQQYNSHLFQARMIETKKRPTVLHISLENTQSEDVDRAFKIYTKKNVGEGFEFDNVRHLWNDSFYNGPIIDISMYHDSGDSMRVSDIDALADSIEDDGYEVIAIVIDYIELIRREDEDRNKDKHEWLTNISEALHTMAGRRDIPVITAHQINRDGQRSKADAKAKGQKNLVRLQNRSFIGGAMGIDKKTDFSIFIDVEYDEDPVTKVKKSYLCLKRDKMRYQRTDRDYFVHEIKNGIILEDDLHEEKYISLPEIPTNRFVHDDDGTTFSGARETGSRGQTEVRKRPEMSETVVQTKKESPMLGIDDKPIDSLFAFAYMIMNQIEPMAPYDMVEEIVDGSAFLFDGIYVDGTGGVFDDLRLKEKNNAH